MSQPVVLVVDDDPVARSIVEECLADEGYRTWSAADGQQARERFKERPDLVLLDYQLPDATGFELVREWRRIDPHTPIIMITGHAGFAHAVEGIKLGLFDYMPKPVDLEVMTRAVRNALTGRVQFPTAGLGLDAVLGASEVMQGLRALLSRAAQSRVATILLTGETGTGKGLVARALHQASPRASGPFMNVTCTALPTGLLESELFGHERGAFTDAKSRKRGLFELADGGTLFLDEVGDMEPELQAKLLRVLEERTFRRVGGTQDIQTDIRLIAATNVDLQAAVTDRKFREDLYYRLAVLVVDMPPLRERGDDVLLLANHFLAELCAVEERPTPEIDEDAAAALRGHPWPGNVRELRNVVERALLMGDGCLDLGWLRIASVDARKRLKTEADLDLPKAGVDMRALERRMVEQALERTGGNVTRAAALLGMNRDQMRYRVAKFGLRVSD